MDYFGYSFHIIVMGNSIIIGGVEMTLREEKDGTFTSHIKQKTTKIQLHQNKEELEQLEKDKYVLNQPKDSTAIKQLAELGSKLLHGEPIGKVYMRMAEMIIENKRKNKRTGLEAEYI